VSELKVIPFGCLAETTIGAPALTILGGLIESLKTTGIPVTFSTLTEREGSLLSSACL
jgi:hypothetical protein